MGLDSYVFRIKKAQGLEPRVYTRAELDRLNLDYFFKGESYESLVQQLMPYSQEVQVKAPQIDFQKICKEHGLSDKAYICLRSGNGDIGFIDPMKKEDRKLIVSGADIQANFLVETTQPYYVHICERVAYWRKNYDVQDFFYENLDHVENTGFYLLNDEVITDFNLKVGDSLGGLPMEAPTEEQALFYHEWY